MPKETFSIVHLSNVHLSNVLPEFHSVYNACQRSYYRMPVRYLTPHCKLSIDSAICVNYPDHLIPEGETVQLIENTLYIFGEIGR